MLVVEVGTAVAGRLQAAAFLALSWNLRIVALDHSTFNTPPPATPDRFSADFLHPYTSSALLAVPAVPSGEAGRLQAAGPGQPHVHVHGGLRVWPQVSTAWHVNSRARDTPGLGISSDTFAGVDYG